MVENTPSKAFTAEYVLLEPYVSDCAITWPADDDVSTSVGSGLTDAAPNAVAATRNAALNAIPNLKERLPIVHTSYLFK